MAKAEFVVGQRWISHSEAELGLGIIKSTAGRRVEISFPAADEQRMYAVDIAPLSRVTYSPGERVSTRENRHFTITARHEHKGCYIYQGTDDKGRAVSVHERDLNSFVQFNQPQERLFAGQIDKNSQFELRLQAQKQLHRLHASPVLGLLGARVQLLPHQIYIAHQVGQRHAPRVLLADEVGLGKTIEAGLIIHQQLLTARAERVLIVVPESLLHQWWLEMLRRFNLSFTLMDAARFQALQQAGEENPFESSQLIVCGLAMLTQSAAIFEQAVRASWDLMVVDEAHHLQWSQRNVSLEYQCIETLARQTTGLLLLTATPEQAGEESHFARLRLLDPERYYDLETFRRQEADYQAVSTLIDRLLADDARQNLTAIATDLAQYLGDERACALQRAEPFEVQRDKVVQALLDRHGTGRVLYRNTRDTVSGFPQRVLHAWPLPKPAGYAARAQHCDVIARLQAERCLGSDWLAQDPRVSWLIEFLAAHKSDKVLLICAQAETAIALEKKLRLTAGIRTAVFHEGLPLINRDRAAAYFADAEEGAQVLICSEIGSEGRNFQFAHHLVLFDLPLNPDLLEQRIGRLDRIGQQHSVHIHVPYYEHSAQSVLLDWYHQGMNAFEQVFAAGGQVYQQLRDELHRCLKQAEDVAAQQQLIQTSRRLTEEIRAALQQGRDRLLELNSCHHAAAQALIADLEQLSDPQALAQFMEQVFDQYGVEQQPQRDDTLILKPGQQLLQHQFPSLPEEGLTATYQRERALVREDLTFLSWEHPMVLGSLDMVIHSDFGNSAFCTLATEQFPEGTLLLEAVFTLHCAAPAAMRIRRYLPQSFTRVVIDEQGHQYQDTLTETVFNQGAGRIPRATAQELVRHAQGKIKTLITQAQSAVIKRQQDVIAQAEARMRASLQHEQARLQALAAVNPNIRQEEIDYLSQLQTQLQSYLQRSQMRLDAVRVALVTQD